MVQQVCLHIGAPKSGSSSLQKYLTLNREALSAQGLAYVTAPGKENANDLAIAFNKQREDLSAICSHLCREIEERAEKTALISSEMLYGFLPDRMLDLLPVLEGKALKILIYLRRQDKYIESMFMQKSKNGRFLGSINDYIAKFDGSGSDYRKMLAPWADADVELAPRILERERLIGGDVVSDALAQLGLTPPTELPEQDVNRSPGIARVQLLQAAAASGIANPRRLQRTLAATFPQEPHERGSIFSPRQRRAFLERFKDGNEELRARFFPEQQTLFDESDVDQPQDQGAIPPFTKSQLDEVFKLLKTIKVVG